jgi:hypothetical protein
MQMTRPRRAAAGGVVVLALAITLFGVGPANATTGSATQAVAEGANSAESDPVVLFARSNGEAFQIDQATIDSAVLAVEAVDPDPDSMSPNLIDFGQWINCIQLGDETGVFASYVHWYNGVPKDVKLRCGKPGPGHHGGYGYRHILTEHEADWQAKLDGARAAGWVSERQGIEGWDDLMSVSTDISMYLADWVGGNPTSGTTCTVTKIYFARLSDPATPVYSYNARAGFANNSDKLLTAFPQFSDVC